VNQNPRTEGLDDRFVQRLRAIDHHQQRAIGIEPALDQVSQQNLRCAGSDSPLPRAQETQRRRRCASFSNPIFRSGEDCRHFNFNSYPDISQLVCLRYLRETPMECESLLHI
jgi:hypothetical protein